MDVTLRPTNFPAMELERTVCLPLPLPFTITRPATVFSFAARLLCSYPPGRAHYLISTADANDEHTIA